MNTLIRKWLAVGLWVLASAALHAEMPGKDTVSLVVVGDIMLEDGPSQAMRRGRDPFAGFAK